MTLCFIGYALGLLALRQCEYEHLSIPKYVQFLLPTLPMLCMVAVILQSVFQLDEMWRKLVTESMAFAGLATAFTCMSFVFIHDLGGPLRPEWGFDAFWLYYAIGVAWSWWRLR
jgi:hypothetical protein